MVSTRRARFGRVETGSAGFFFAVPAGMAPTWRNCVHCKERDLAMPSLLPS